jgi:hypothetical protein
MNLHTILAALGGVCGLLVAVALLISRLIAARLGDMRREEAQRYARDFGAED